MILIFSFIEANFHYSTDDGKGNAKDSQVYAALMNSVGSGYIGNLRVDPSYLKVNQLLGTTGLGVVKGTFDTQRETHDTLHGEGNGNARPGSPNFESMFDSPQNLNPYASPQNPSTLYTSPHMGYSQKEVGNNSVQYDPEPQPEPGSHNSTNPLQVSFEIFFSLV